MSHSTARAECVYFFLFCSFWRVGYPCSSRACRRFRVSPLRVSRAEISLFDWSGFGMQHQRSLPGKCQFARALLKSTHSVSLRGLERLLRRSEEISSCFHGTAEESGDSRQVLWITVHSSFPHANAGHVRKLSPWNWVLQKLIVTQLLKK
jgi:hypothetical protein